MKILGYALILLGSIHAINNFSMMGPVVPGQVQSGPGIPLDVLGYFPTGSGTTDTVIGAGVAALGFYLVMR